VGSSRGGYGDKLLYNLKRILDGYDRGKRCQKNGNLRFKIDRKKGENSVNKLL